MNNVNLHLQLFLKVREQAKNSLSKMAVLSQCSKRLKF